MTVSKAFDMIFDMGQYVRPVFGTLRSRVLQERRFIQVLAGPRQVGKTTLARQLIKTLDMPCHYVSADEPTLQDRTWLSQQWDSARLKAGTSGSRREVLLVIDEVQKVQGWSETVKRLWDEDSAAGLPVKVVLLGSSSLLVQRGLTESLAGRFEVIPVTHWSYPEMRDCFGVTLDQYLLFGGYPGAAPLIDDAQRWSSYIRDSLIETTVSRDILLLTRVDKPALLRRLFGLVCAVLWTDPILSEDAWSAPGCRQHDHPGPLSGPVGGRAWRWASASMRQAAPDAGGQVQSCWS